MKIFRVVLHVKPLPHEIRGDRLEAHERLQASLENDHLLVAVHPLDAEDRFRVQLADGAGDGIGCHPFMETLSLSSRIPAKERGLTSQRMPGPKGPGLPHR